MPSALTLRSNDAVNCCVRMLKYLFAMQLCNCVIGTAFTRQRLSLHARRDSPRVEWLQDSTLETSEQFKAARWPYRQRARSQLNCTQKNVLLLVNKEAPARTARTRPAGGTTSRGRLFIRTYDNHEYRIRRVF